MAFYSMLTRASSSALPLAIRTVRRSRVPILQFSTETEATKQIADDNWICVFEPKNQLTKESEDLIGVLESKIQRIKESDDHKFVEEMTDEFPFEIQRNPEKRSTLLTRDLLLRREWQDEIIEVKGYIDYDEADEDDEVDEDDEDDEDENSDEDDDKEDTKYFLDVIVTKQSGMKLEFDVIANATQNRIIIDSLSIKQPNDSVIEYDKPEPSLLDKKMKKGFVKYLEVRGIKPSILNLLPKCVVKKHSNERLEWFNKLKHFVEE